MDTRQQQIENAIDVLRGEGYKVIEPEKKKEWEIVYVGKDDSIHSVKRLSDKECFSVGDNIEWGGSAGSIMITGFEVSPRNGNLLALYRNGGVGYKKIRKVKPETKAPDSFKLNDEWALSSAKPPLGIIPEFIWKKQRLKNILEAMNRFNKHYENKKHCPQYWLDEKHELEKWISGYKLKFAAPKKERIEVTEFYYEHSTAHGKEYVVATDKMIPEDKFPLIKQAIEKVLNENKDVMSEENAAFGQAAYQRAMKTFSSEKIFTLKELEEAQRLAFQAARSVRGCYSGGIKTYPTFNDYINRDK